MAMLESTGSVSSVSNALAGIPATGEHGLCYDLLVGVGANLLTAFLVIGPLFAWEFLIRRGRLITFFGLTKEKTLRIFIGHLAHPTIPMGAVGFEESSHALKLAALFKSLIPGLSDKPGFLRYLEVADVVVTVEPAPRNHSSVNLEHSTIAIGSSSSNYAGQLIEDQLHCPVRFVQSPSSIQIPSLPPITSVSQGVVVKLCRDGRAFFYVAGLTEPASATAARFLLKSWRLMRKQYGDDISFYYLVEQSSRALDEIQIVAHGPLPRVAQ